MQHLTHLEKMLTEPKKMFRNIGLIFILIVLPFLTQGQIVGKWKTIDDRNGDSKAIIQLYKKGDALYGKIVKVLQKDKQGALCEKCDGDLKDKPILGMEIITHFEADDDGVYKGKRLFDPEQGMTFRGKIWLDPDDESKLKVRGYLAFLHRTQTWERVED